MIKELSSHLTAGPAALFSTWSPYVLAVTGAAATLLASHAMSAGPLAAAQPGFTIGDPVTAILLGTFLFGEHLGTSPAALAAEVLGLLVLALGVRTLSRSELITGTPLRSATDSDAAPGAPGVGAAASGPESAALGTGAAWGCGVGAAVRCLRGSTRSWYW